MKSKLFILFFITIFIFVVMTGCCNDSGNTSENNTQNTSEILAKKPVIYLYPETKMQVSVSMNFNGDLIYTDPIYNDGWNVTAYPDGTLVTGDNKEYKYLFWEGYNHFELNMEKGFCINGKETEAFLKEKLIYMGLSENEMQEFIEFWIPEMEDNEYNLICFQGEEYTDNVVLDINPVPDSELRVFMAYKALDRPVEVESQTLNRFTRVGFAVVEWGGCEIN